MKVVTNTSSPASINILLGYGIKNSSIVIVTKTISVRVKKKKKNVLTSMNIKMEKPVLSVYL